MSIQLHVSLVHNGILFKSDGFYPYKRSEIRTRTISPGGRGISLDNFTFGKLPSTLIFGMVDNAAFIGSKSLNPFNFQHYNMTFFSLFMNDLQIPSRGITTNIKAKMVTGAYYSLMKGIGIRNNDRGIQITYENFLNGFTIYAFDLTPDQSGHEDHTSLPNQGPLRIEAYFDNPLPKTITCIIYLEYDACIEIDKDRNVILT